MSQSCCTATGIETRQAPIQFVTEPPGSFTEGVWVLTHTTGNSREGFSLAAVTAGTTVGREGQCPSFYR